MRKITLILLFAILAAMGSLRPAFCQIVLFDFDNAPYRSSLPVDVTDVTLGTVTAHLSSGSAFYNYSIQSANVLGFTPTGFSGLCIYPNQVYACDLVISFNAALSAASIMYAPEEYATDSSCTMRMTAYYGSQFVATQTYVNPNPGTWPVGIISLTAAKPFNRIVVHYEKPPVTGGDWGPIFMADNLIITLWSSPYARIDGVTSFPGGTVRLQGVSLPNPTVTIESTDNLSQPFTFLTSVPAAGDGSFTFDDPTSYMVKARFYRVTVP